MRRFRDIPIQQKLMWVIVLTSGGTLFLASIGLLAYEVFNFRSEMVRTVWTQADIVGYNATSALVFDDAASASATLEALQAAPAIVEAAIYDREGNRFASFVSLAAGERALATVLVEEATGFRFEGQRLLVWRPLYSGKRQVGTLVIVADLGSMYSRLAGYAGITALVFGVAIALAVAISWRGQRVISEPIRRLAETARIVSERKNFSVRATPTGQDELGVLIRSFNEMLDQIQRRDTELESARDAAEAGNRAKDEFLATVSHELRTPLTPILSWVTLLRAGKLDDAGRQRAFESIERNARSQAQLIEDLLDVSRIIAGKLRLDVRPLDLVPVIEAAIDSTRPAAEAKGIRIESLFASPSGVVAADPERLQQVFWNLLSNAVKFTPRGGRVQVRLQRVDSHVEVSVADTGQGIDPAFLPVVFDRFRQADSTSTRAHGGLGLGLAIVRHILELHGGGVRAESEGRGKGATFTIELPISAVRPLAPPPAEAADQRLPEAHFGPMPDLTGRRVLVVDDDVDTIDTLESLLEQCGANVRSARSVPEALAIFEKWPPDVLISDIGMPGEDGYDLIRAVRSRPVERGGQVPALALTAYARVEDRLKVFSAGYQLHVAKPVEPAELVAVIASLSEWHAGRARLS